MAYPDPPTPHGSFSVGDIESWWTEPPLEWIAFYANQASASFLSNLPAVDNPTSYYAVRQTEPIDDVEQANLVWTLCHFNTGFAIGYYQRNQGRWPTLTGYGPCLLQEESLGIVSAYSLADALDATWKIWTTVGPSYWGFTLAQLRSTQDYQTALALSQTYVPGQPPSATAPPPSGFETSGGWTHLVTSLGSGVPTSGRTMSSYADMIRQAII